MSNKMDASEQETHKKTSGDLGTRYDGQPDGQSHSNIYIIGILLVALLIVILLLLLVVTCVIKTEQHQTLRQNLKAFFKCRNKNRHQCAPRSAMCNSIEMIDMSVPSSSQRSSTNSKRNSVYNRTLQDSGITSYGSYTGSNVIVGKSRFSRGPSVTSGRSMDAMWNKINDLEDKFLNMKSTSSMVN